MRGASESTRPSWRERRVQLLPAETWLVVRVLRGTGARMPRTSVPLRSRNNPTSPPDAYLRDRPPIPVPYCIQLERLEPAARPKDVTAQDGEVSPVSAGVRQHVDDRCAQFRV